MTKSSAPVRPDRKGIQPVPRGLRRRQELVLIAEEVFFEHGFNEVTMQHVAARAGASKETLYRHFHNKDELLTEVVTNRITRLIVPLTSALERRGTIRQVLVDFATELLRTMMDADVVALLRIVVAETPRRPALGQIFFRIGPEHARTTLTAFLTAAQERGEIRVPDAHLAATILLGGVMSYAHAAGLVLVNLPPLTPAEVARRVEEVVAMFLQRYGVA